MDRSAERYGHVPGHGPYDIPGAFSVETAPARTQAGPAHEHLPTANVPRTYGGLGNPTYASNPAAEQHGGMYPEAYHSRMAGYHPLATQHSSPQVVLGLSQGHYVPWGAPWAPQVAPRAPRSTAAQTPPASLNRREGTPSPSPLANCSLGLRADIFHPLSLFDIATTGIRKLVKQTHLPHDEVMRQLAEILMLGTKDLSICRLEQLLAWPLLQAAWQDFMRDALEYSPAGYIPAPNAHRFSTIIFNMNLATMTEAKKKWRVTPPSTTSTLKTNIHRVLTRGKETPSSRTNVEMNLESDLGLPAPSLLPTLLLPILNHTPKTDTGMSHTNPVNPSLLSQYTNPGPTHPNWRKTGRGSCERACTIEDYYARFVLVCLEGLYPPTPTRHPSVMVPGEAVNRNRTRQREQQQQQQGENKETREWREQVAWLRGGGDHGVGEMDGSVREQVWVLFCVLFFLHCQKREEVMEGMREEKRGLKGVVRGLFCWRGHGGKGMSDEEGPGWGWEMRW